MSDGRLADLPGRVERFLLKALKEKSLKDYTAALRAFTIEVECAGFSWKGATELERDAFLAEWLVDRHEAGGRRQECVLVVTALHKITPHQRYKASSAALMTWAKLEPPKQAPACPEALAGALVVLAWSLNQREVALCMGFCFEGLLRVSEPLRLRHKDVVANDEGVCLLLGETKRGLEQKVVIKCRWLQVLLTDFLGTAKHGPDDEVFGIGYARVHYWLRKLSKALGVEALELSSHSFRRGGASHLLTLGWKVEDVCLYGRWASVTSAKEYLRRGETFLTRARLMMSDALWQRITRLASLRHCLLQQPIIVD